jgi:hypothetical protein
MPYRSRLVQDRRKSESSITSCASRDSCAAVRDSGNVQRREVEECSDIWSQGFQAHQVSPSFALVRSTVPRLTSVLDRYLLLNNETGSILRESLGDIGFADLEVSLHQLFPLLVLTCLTISPEGESASPQAGQHPPGALATVYILRPVALDVLLDRCAADQITQLLTIFGVGFAEPFGVQGDKGCLKDVDKVFLLGKGAITPYFQGRDFDFDKDSTCRIVRGPHGTYVLAIRTDEANEDLFATFDLYFACVKYGMAPREAGNRGNVQLRCNMHLTPAAVLRLAEYVGFSADLELCFSSVEILGANGVFCRFVMIASLSKLR